VVTRAKPKSSHEKNATKKDKKENKAAAAHPSASLPSLDVLCQEIDATVGDSADTGDHCFINNNQEIVNLISPPPPILQQVGLQNVASQVSVSQQLW